MALFLYWQAVRDHSDMRSKSYVKWVGDKTKLTSAIGDRLPTAYGDYIEPFVGGGSLFFETLPGCALLADANERLVRTHVAVRDEPEKVIALLSAYRNEPDFFELMRKRSQSIDAESDAEVAAWMIFLSKTAHGGLYRVNSSNGYNVPFGKRKAPHICNTDRIRTCSAALQAASIECASFETTMLRAREGDFVYCDPPYAKVATTSFVGYTADGFAGYQHIKLRDIAIDLGRRGVHVLISNSDAPAVRDLYRGNGFHLQEVPVRRHLPVKSRHRGVVNELLISNYPPDHAVLARTGI